jgi:glycosyltransferase involved in cell wall biosynthesis
MNVGLDEQRQRVGSVFAHYRGAARCASRFLPVKVIVGITTTKARLGVFFYSLQSLRRQSYRDFNIFLSLSREPYLFDEGIDMVPAWMEGDRVQVHFVANSGPYRKLLPAIADASDEDIVVTADDDVLYADNWLMKIVKAAESHPDHIVCGRAREIQKNLVGRFQNYSNWPLISGRDTGLLLLPIGCAGVAYRKNLLDLRFALDPVYKEYAPTADDIWFRLASLRKNVEVYVDTEIESGNSYIQHFRGLEQLNLYRPAQMRSLPVREFTRIVTRSRDYWGFPVSRNDVAWSKTLAMLKSRGQGINL